MHKVRFFSVFAIFLMLGFSTLVIIADDAEARRFGGGSSFGSRGSRSFSAPRLATPTSRVNTTRPSNSQPTASALPGRSGIGSGMSSGLMGGLGGLMLGGLLGSMLFGGGSGAGNMAGAAGGMGGSGIGLLEILLLGGLAWFAFRWFKQQKNKTPVPAEGMYATSREGMAEPFGNQSSLGNAPSSFVGNQQDDVSQGLQSIASMDPTFDENRFMDGAKMAFQQIQGSWSDWSVERLRPLLTERVWEMIQSQANKRKAAGKRDIIEKIHFDKVEISEAWQEAGEDWITVHLFVDMVDYTTDVSGKVLEGDPNVSSKVEEYWTFTRPIGNRDPNWFLAAIQQPGEVARSIN